MKTLTKTALCGLYKYSGAMRMQEWLARRRGASFMTVLIFHRVTDAIPPDGLTVTTAWFRRFCRMVRRGFRVMPLAEIYRILKTGEKPPPRTLAITFDDSYRDNLFAARVLAEHGLPACFFIPTAHVGTDHVYPWDRELPRMANLTWEDVSEMASLGHEIGSHTVTHPDLGRLSDEEVRHELVESRRVLEDRLDRRVRWFAYPFGGREHFREACLPLVQQAGYEGTVSAYGGSVHTGRDYPIVPREAVPEFRSVLNLELHLSGCLQWMYAIKQGMLQHAGPEVHRRVAPDGAQLKPM